MDRAQMTPNEINSTNSEITGLMLPPVQIGPYVISEENKFGSFGYTLGILEMRDSIDYNVSDNVSNFYNHGVVRGCSILLCNNQNNPDCLNCTCCLASISHVVDLQLHYATYYTSYTNFNINATDLECNNC